MLYFFDVSGSGPVTSDDEGTELATREDAAALAARIAAEIAFHELSRAEAAALTLQVAVREGRSVLLTTKLSIEPVGR